MADKLWKAYERRIARLFGTERLGPTGEATEDFSTHWLAAECKTRKSLPAWLKDAIAQVVSAAKAEQLPIAILHERGVRWRDDIVVMRLGDFIDWFDPKGGQADGTDEA